MNDKNKKMREDRKAVLIVEDLLNKHLVDEDYDYLKELNRETASYKEEILYREIYAPTKTAELEFFDFLYMRRISDMWRGQRASINELDNLGLKAWWLLYYFAVKEAAERNDTEPGTRWYQDRLNQFSRGVTCAILDDEMSVRDAINHCNSDVINLPGDLVDRLVDDISKQIEEYRNWRL